MSEISSSHTSKLDWFLQARFGMFIHWGLYAITAGEWNGRKGYSEWIQQQASIPTAEYSRLAAQFNPKQFNAREWVQLAVDAGMKYLVFTAKHHDGFCLFDSQLTDFTITRSSPFERDPLLELSQACQEKGVTFCVYYSVKDWHHPHYPTLYTNRTRLHPDGFHGDPNPNADYLKYLDYMKGQLREILTRYGPIGILWFDYSDTGPAEPPYRAKTQEIVDMIHELQPACLINNRLAGMGADYGTPEQYIPDGVSKTTFEVCMTVNHTWGYSREDQQWKSPETMIHNLATIVSRGGNYLVNVGPDATGSIPEACTQVLLKMGDWMKLHGSSIYGAGPADDRIRAPKKEGGIITTRGDRFYLHVAEWPQSKSIFLRDFRFKFHKAYLLSDPQQTPLKVEVYRRSLLVHLPDMVLPKPNQVIVIEYSPGSV